MKSLIMKSLLTGLIITSALGEVHAQTKGSVGRGSSQSTSANNNSNNGDGGSNPDAAIITCASRYCMDQQANYAAPGRGRKPVRKAAATPDKDCDKWERWVVFPGGIVRKVRDCRTRVNVINY